MAHNLEINGDGTARFAYSNHQRPWHLLGTPMLGLQTVDTMLAAADADFAVRIVKIAAVDENGQLLTNPDGTPVLIEDSRATIRDNGNGTFDGLATVGTRYHVQQNREVLERALAVVGYLDHWRDATPEARALTSMEESSWVTRKKIEAQQAVLTLV